MEGIRIIEIPKCKMVSSGEVAEGEAGENFFDGKFPKWFGKLPTDLFPRDFLLHNPQKNTLVWYYALPENTNIDTMDFAIIDFHGGLYATAVSKDGDDEDGLRVFNGIKEWVEKSGCFELDERENHNHMFNIITPPKAKECMGYEQLEIYVPIKIKT